MLFVWLVLTAWDGTIAAGRHNIDQSADNATEKDIKQTDKMEQDMCW